MSGLDIEGVLAGHYTYTAGRGLTVRCKCGAVVGERGGRTGTGNSATHRAHVAAILREQIAAWLGSDDAEESVYEALDPGGHGWAAGDSPSVRETIRALAAQVAPSRVPSEES